MVAGRRNRRVCRFTEARDVFARSNRVAWPSRQQHAPVMLSRVGRRHPQESSLPVMPSSRSPYGSILFSRSSVQQGSNDAGVGLRNFGAWCFICDGPRYAEICSTLIGSMRASVLATPYARCRGQACSPRTASRAASVVPRSLVGRFMGEPAARVRIADSRDRSNPMRRRCKARDRCAGPNGSREQKRAA